MCERLPEERREDGKEKTNDDKSRLFMGFCECAKYSLVSVEEKQINYLLTKRETGQEDSE